MDSLSAKQKGILREALKTPAYKDILRTTLGSLGHTKGSPGMNALMSEDPEVFLALASSVPHLVNMLVRALTELGANLRNQFAPEILAAFMESIVREIDTDALKKCGEVWLGLASGLWSASREARAAFMELALSKGPGLAAKPIDVLSRAINSLEEERPGAVSAFTADLLASLDRPASSRALETVANGVLDQKWHLVSWSCTLVSNRIRKLFGSRRP